MAVRTFFLFQRLVYLFKSILIYIPADFIFSNCNLSIFTANTSSEVAFD